MELCCIYFIFGGVGKYVFFRYPAIEFAFWFRPITYG